MDMMSIAQVDQDRCLKECMEVVPLSAVMDTEMGSVALKGNTESELVLKNQMGQGLLPYEKLTYDMGFSAGKVGDDSSTKATSTDGGKIMGTQIYLVPVICHLSGIQTRAFCEEPNENGQERTWPMQDLMSGNAIQNWSMMNEQIPSEVNGCPVETTPKCILNKGSNCQIVGRKLLGTMDEESRHSRWEEFRKFASKDTTTEECSTLLKRMELEASDDEEMINVDDMMTLEESGVLPKSDHGENIIHEEAEKKVQKRKTG